MSNWIAYGPKGNPLASFSHRDLAERFRDDRAHIGVVVTIRRVIEQRRAA
jgi:hypothetical protein